MLNLFLAFSRNTKVVVLDEPLKDIDPIMRSQVLNLIIRQFSMDKMIIMATHPIGEIESILDQVVFLHCGEVLFVKNAETIREVYGKSIENHDSVKLK